MPQEEIESRTSRSRRRRHRSALALAAAPQPAVERIGAAMASSTEIMHADQETIPIVGGGPAPDTRGKQPVVDVTPPRHNNPKQVSEAASSSESTEALMSTIRAAAAEAEAKVIGPRTPLPGNRRWWRRLFPPDPLSSIPVGQPLDAQQERMLIKKALR